MSAPFGSLPTRFEPAGTRRGEALVVPGVGYSPAAPLLEFARQALLQHGYAVQQLWWDVPSDDDVDATDWVTGQVAGAVSAAPDLVCGKSLGTHAASYAAEHASDGIWLTPMLGNEGLVAAIRANAEAGRRQLLVGGTADAAWRPDVARELEAAGCDVCTIEGGDHLLWFPDDAVRGAEAQVLVSRAVETFLSGTRAWS